MSASEPIRVIRDASVYLVGRQMVNDTELDRFLVEHGVSWQSDTEVAGEYLVEAAGRVCYMSFAKPRPGGNATYLGHILEVGHGSVLEHSVWNFLFTGVSRSLTHELIRHRAGWGYCLTGDTLIYSDKFTRGKREGTKKRPLRQLYEMTKTPHGRSRIKLLRLRCLDERTGIFTTGKVAQIVYSGLKPVFRVELEDGKTITCSRDHRFLTPEGWRPLHEIVGGLEVARGGFAVHGTCRFPIATNGIPVYQDREWLKQRYVDEGLEQKVIAELAGVTSHTIRSWVRNHHLQKTMGSWCVGRTPWNKGKRYSAGWKHTPETCKRLSELKRGENNPQWRGGITKFATQIRRGVEDLLPLVFARDQYICRLCARRGGNLEGHHILPVWARPDLVCEMSNIATLCEGCHASIAGRELEFAERLGAPLPEVAVHAGKKPPQGTPCAFAPKLCQIRAVAYAGEQDTYDIEMEGANHNFVANGIVTHNSQLSQRYVDESVAEYVEPDCIGDDPELHRLWLDAVASSHRAYMQLVEKLTEKFKDEPDRTLRRKMARQAARSVLPNATETKIFVTANGRALRDFIELRGSRYAEPEIRKLAVGVLKIMQQEAPNLFGDYQLVPLPDGTQEAVTQHRKV